jgi:hypothetical protein
MASLFLVHPPGWAQKPGHGRGEYFNVRDFGAKGAGGDDTEAIMAAIAAANGVHWSMQPPGTSYYISAPTVFIPSGKYVISDTLPAGHCNILGEGSSIIHMSDPEKDIFSGGGVWRWKISGVTLFGGRHQLNIGNPNIDSGQIIIDKCTFQKAHGVAVNIRKGTPSTQLLVKDCIFIHNLQVLVNYCDLAVLKDSWISTTARMKDKAVIENYNVLNVENILGVPDVDANANQRWFDNYGILRCRNIRFGGEGGGFTAVFNYAKYINRYPQAQGTAVILEDSTFFCARNDRIHSAVYLEEIPNQLIVTHSSGFISGGARGWSVVKVSPNMNLDTYFDDVRVGGIRICIDETLTTGIHDDLDYFTELPEQLKPYQVNEIVSDAAPTKGIWRRGQFVRNRNSEGRWAPGVMIWGDPEKEEGKKYFRNKASAMEAPYGWYCTESGKPGTWKPVYFSFIPPSSTSESQ